MLIRLQLRALSGPGLHVPISVSSDGAACLSCWHPKTATRLCHLHGPPQGWTLSTPKPDPPEDISPTSASGQAAVWAQV